MAEPSRDNDQSMEDILQSIKRIIADEGEHAPAAAGSDVLELTDLLAEDAAVPDPVAVEVATAVDTMSIDEIMAVPLSSMPEPEATVALHVDPAPEAKPEPVKPEPVVVTAVREPTHTVDTEGLISDATLAASVSALSALAQKPSPVGLSAHGHSFRSGTTVEDLVVESLRPMLKEWLDDHLPALVRNLVEKEIRRLSV